MVIEGIDTPAPKLEADGDHGGAPTYTHGHFPAPKLESHGNTGVPANTEPGGGI
ncbi:group-specific protein [Bacillus sp. 16GRE42]|nr:group-specific protein [Bacillus sp. 16GRE42]